MAELKNVCVYCGSGPGTNPRFAEAAKAFGKSLAENGIRLVYGGGSIGLMGAVATSALEHGGSVTGIIPDFLTARENALTRVQEMVVTPDMHERKRLMFERSDAFVALPGGIHQAHQPEPEVAPQPGPPAVPEQGRGPLDRVERAELLDDQHRDDQGRGAGPGQAQ